MAVAEQNTDPRTIADRHNVQIAVMIQIADYDRRRAGDRKSDRWSKGESEQRARFHFLEKEYWPVSGYLAHFQLVRPSQQTFQV
jgi:hypothetical protein